MIANQYIESLLNNYGFYDYYEPNSKEELIMRKNVINTNNTICNNLFVNRQLNEYERAYLVYTIITGFEIRNDNDGIEWSKYVNTFNNKFYSKNIALTSGQNKLLILSLISDDYEPYSNILNVYQIIYLNDILKNEGWSIDNYQSVIHLDYQPTYQGLRNIDISDIINDMFHNTTTKYNTDDMLEYIILTFKKLYSFNRFVGNGKSYNIEQFTQLLNLLVSNININNKFREFINILDAEQISMIGF
jgi:hypothetical protein